MYSTSSVSYKIDWSDSKTYTEAQRQSLLTNANGVLSDPYNIDTLPYFYDEYYWGCSHICLPTRYDMNIAWVWLSLAVCLSEVALAVMSFWLSRIYIEPVESTREERKGLLEVVEATPVEDVEANKNPTEDDDEKPDQTESEESNSGDNNESSSSDPSEATLGDNGFRLKL